MLLHIEVDTKEINDFHKKIADNVKKIRKEKGITQTDLALSMGHKSVSTIGKIEAGLENKHYNIEQLYKIALILDVDIREFFVK